MSRLMLRSLFMEVNQAQAACPFTHRSWILSKTFWQTESYSKAHWEQDGFRNISVNEVNKTDCHTRLGLSRNITLPMRKSKRILRIKEWMCWNLFDHKPRGHCQSQPKLLISAQIDQSKGELPNRRCTYKKANRGI
jgi:hypothetical protein